MGIRLFFKNTVCKLTSLFSASHSSAKHGEQPMAHRDCQVLFVNGCDLPTLRRYRVEHQREQLELWGIRTDEVYYMDVVGDDALRAEAFVVYRCPITDNVRSLIEEAHTLGKKVYFDVDDLVTSTSYTDNLPVVKAMSPEDKGIFDDGVTRNGVTLSLCDGAIATTERLAMELAKVVPEVLVNRNVASQAMENQAAEALATRHLDPTRVILGYFSGSMTHNEDFRIILPALNEVLQKREHVFLKVVGDLEVPHELAGFKDRIICSERVDWKELSALIASVDINLAPIEPTLFNEAKSENKWVEASLVEVPTVASNFGAFAHMINDGTTGLLCSTDAEWRDALLHLVDDRELRHDLGHKARLFVTEHCTTRHTGFSLAHLLCNLPFDIEHLTPRDPQAQALWVDEYLATRGLTRNHNALEPEPWQGIDLASRVRNANNALNNGRKLAILVYERNCGDAATFRYFGYNVAQRLASSKRWAATWVFVDELDRTRELVEQASLITLIRCRIRPELLNLANLARNKGIPIAYSIDDDVLGKNRAPRIIQAMASDPTDPFEQTFWRGTTIRFQLAAELADSLVVPNDYFANLLQKRCDKPVSVIHSSLNDEQVTIARAIISDNNAKTSRDFTIGYFSGTASHQEDFALVRDTLVHFLSDHPDARLLLGGALSLDEELYRFHRQDRVIVMPHVDYATLQYLQASVEVVLAPLVVDEFSNCKSGLKVFEAGVVGTASCASPSFSYTEAINNGESGFVCNSPTDWSQALEALYSDPRACRIMGERARNRALSRYHGAAIMAEIEHAFDLAAEAKMLPIPSEVEESIVQNAQVSDWDDPFEPSVSFGQQETG